MKQDKEINEKPKNDHILAALLEIPLVFKLGRTKYKLYPQSLGVSLLIAQEIEDLEINAQLLAISPITETIRLAQQKAHVVARIIALAVCHDRDKIYDADYFPNMVDNFECMDVEDRAALLDYILKQDHTQDIIQDLKIDDEIRQMQKTIRAKEHDDNTLTFCGVSVWGSLIDWAAERYGWSYDYIVWGISYQSLKMLQADQVRQVYLTDEERKKVHIIRPGDDVVRVDEMTYEEFTQKYKFN